jgi:hypothetical protein
MSGPAYRFVFLLPPAVSLLAPPGRHQPCQHGCILNVGPQGLVSIEAPTRWQLFDQARRFLRVIAKGRPAMSIATNLYTPPSHVGGRAGIDGWQIVVNAEISIVPTSLPADLGEPLERAG